MHRRRQPRALTLTLPDTKQPYLLLGGSKFLLRNFSEEGIGLWMVGTPPFGLVAGTRVSGDIVVGPHIYPVNLEVKHGSQHTVGLSITHKSPELDTLFHELLRPANQAAQLVARPESGAEDSKVGLRRLWYIGNGSTELVIWFSAPYQVRVVQVCWLGNWVFREQFRPTRTGRVPDPHVAQSGEILASHPTLIEDREPNSSIIRDAAQFLAAVPPPLPGYLLWQFLETGDVVNLPEDVMLSSKVA